MSPALRARSSPTHPPALRASPRARAGLVRVVVLVVAVVIAGGLALTAGPRLLAAGRGGGDRAAPGQATVVRVVDGDTLVVALGDRTETVRLIGIDTPESVARDRPDECYGAEASHRLAELVPPGTVVQLSRDLEPRDVYDRLLAYVHRPSDGLFVNAALVAGGFAEARHYPPNTTYRPDFEQAERAARGVGRGLWSVCGGPDVPLEPPAGPAPAARGP